MSPNVSKHPPLCQYKRHPKLLARMTGALLLWLPSSVNVLRSLSDHICSVLPASLDPLQFAYRNNRSTDDAIAFTLHAALSHLDKRNTYERMLFVDYSSAFNTIVPSKLVVKLHSLGLNNSLSSWILDFLTGRRHVVINISSPLTLNTGAPQPSPVLPVHAWLCSHAQLQRHRQICGWQRWYRWRWISL